MNSVEGPKCENVRIMISVTVALSLISSYLCRKWFRFTTNNYKSSDLTQNGFLESMAIK